MGTALACAYGSHLLGLYPSQPPQWNAVHGRHQRYFAKGFEHREGIVAGFTKRHAVKRLVWCELHDSIDEAIAREKRVKRWKRAWKLALIEKDNSEWDDLYSTLA